MYINDLKFDIPTQSSYEKTSKIKVTCKWTHNQGEPVAAQEIHKYIQEITHLKKCNFTCVLSYDYNTCFLQANPVKEHGNSWWRNVVKNLKSMEKKPILACNPLEMEIDKNVSSINRPSSEVPAKSEIQLQDPETKYLLNDQIILLFNLINTKFEDLILKLHICTMKNDITTEDCENLLACLINIRDTFHKLSRYKENSDYKKISIGLKSLTLTEIIDAANELKNKIASLKNIGISLSTFKSGLSKDAQFYNPIKTIILDMSIIYYHLVNYKNVSLKNITPSCAALSEKLSDNNHPKFTNELDENAIFNNQKRF